jgi:hypothetical protein
MHLGYETFNITFSSPALVLDPIIFQGTIQQFVAFLSLVIGHDIFFFNVSPYIHHESATEVLNGLNIIYIRPSASAGQICTTQG